MSAVTPKTAPELDGMREAGRLAAEVLDMIAPYVEVTKYLEKEFPKIKLNAGHDLNLDNLDFILKNIPRIKEVSIGHALVCDAIDYGLKETISKYKQIAQR